jgi:hypothetical protein
MNSKQLWSEQDARGVEWVGYNDGTLSALNGSRGVFSRGSSHGARALELTRDFIKSARSADEVEYFYRESRLRARSGDPLNIDEIACAIREELELDKCPG